MKVITSYDELVRQGAKELPSDHYYFIFREFGHYTVGIFRKRKRLTDRRVATWHLSTGGDVVRACNYAHDKAFGPGPAVAVNVELGPRG